MVTREEAVKVQLTEAHKYVQQFMAMRIAAFGTTVGFVGAILSVIYKVDSSVHARLSLWVFLSLVLLFAGQMLGAMARAIWLFCAHMFMMERDFYGPGGNHQWIVANLINRRYSSTYGLYIAFLMLVLGTLPLLIVDVWVAELSLPQRSIAIAAAIAFWLVLLVLTTKNMEPRRVICDAIAQAIRDEETIRWFETLSPAELGGQMIEKKQLSPYATLLSAWRRERGTRVASNDAASVPVRT